MAAQCLVVDLGSGYIKAGPAHLTEPSAVFPSIVGRPRRRYLSSFQGTPVWCGEEAVEGRSKLTLVSPIDHGHIEDWNLVDEIWAHIFSIKHLQNEKHGNIETYENFGESLTNLPSVLITQPPKASRTHQQKIVETIFEVFGCPELNIQIQGLLALYSVASTTGLSVEIGEGVTQILPCVEGECLPEGICRIDCGGQELTMYLQKLLCNNGFPFTTRDEYEYCRLIKESYCYVPLDPSVEDLRNDLDTTFTLPDGFRLRNGASSITVGPERFYCPEALFNPSLIDKDHSPLYDLVMGAIARSPIDLRTNMLENIVLSGGSSLFQGLPDRLTDTLVRIVPRTKQHLVKIRKPQNGVYAVWQGGKILCELKDVQQASWIGLPQYQEQGEACLERYNIHY